MSDQPRQPEFFRLVDDDPNGSPVIQLRPATGGARGASMTFMFPGEPWHTVYLSADRMAALIAALQRQQVAK